MFGIGGCDCEEVKSSMFWALRRGKREHQNNRLCRGTESKWLADERMDLAGLRYCKSSVR